MTDFSSSLHQVKKRLQLFKSRLENRRLLVAISLVLLLLLAGTATALIVNRQQSAPVPDQELVTPEPEVILSGTIEVITGTATISGPATQLTLAAGETGTLSDGETITTEVESLAIIEYHDGTLVRMGPESSITYQAEDKKLHFFQIVGQVYYRFQKILSLTESLDVETSGALATVRGTAFGVFSGDPDWIVVTDSVVEVMQKDQAGNPLEQTIASVSADMRVEVKVATDSSEVKPLVPIDMDSLEISASQSAWLEYNRQADQIYDQGGRGGANLQEFATLLLTQLRATPTPTPTPTPSVSPTATPIPVPKITSMLGTGYQTGSVQTDVGTFSLSCIGANKNSVRVITDSANENDCANDCPVKPLAEFVTSNGGFAGMNGMYFCPADYPACADKKNSFDTLLFNYRVKRYINSDNNVYSVIPFLVVDGAGNPRFLEKSLEWGRDTSITAGIAGNPLLVRNGQYVAENTSLDDKQRNTKSNRGAFVQEGDNLYLCVVRGATVPDSGKVYQALGVDNAINIDGGGSSALWVNGGYKFGPGRAIPNAIIFQSR